MTKTTEELLADALARIELAKHALIVQGYFKADELSDDIAPRITEMASHLEQRAERLAAALEWSKAINAAKRPYDEMRERLYVAVRKWIDDLELDKDLEPGETYWPNSEVVYQSDSILLALPELGVVVFDALKDMHTLLASPAVTPSAPDAPPSETIDYGIIGPWKNNLANKVAQLIADNFQMTFAQRAAILGIIEAHYKYAPDAERLRSALITEALEFYAGKNHLDGMDDWRVRQGDFDNWLSNDPDAGSERVEDGTIASLALAGRIDELRAVLAGKG